MSLPLQKSPKAARNLSTRASRLDRIDNWPTRIRAARYRAAQVARAAGVTTRHLRRHFLKHFALTLRDGIHALRMRDALALLRTDAAVKSIAIQLHYLEPAHFCREFRRFHGVSPEEMRAQVQMSLLDHKSPIPIIERAFLDRTSGVVLLTVRSRNSGSEEAVTQREYDQTSIFGDDGNEWPSPEFLPKSKKLR